MVVGLAAGIVSVAGISPAVVGAQGDPARIALVVRPHVGDTLHMQMDQTYEIANDPSAKTPTRPLRATICVCTHAIVTKRTSTGTELLSTTDSVTVSPSTALATSLFAETKRALEGRTVRLHVGTDGAITVLTTKPRSSDRAPNSPSSDLSSEALQMPPILPNTTVRVGDSWVRELDVPLGPRTGSGRVRATFHLDSLGPDRSIAYLSMRATLEREFTTPSNDPTSAAPRHGALSGTMVGTMQIDRRAEWMIDSRTTVHLTSKLPSAPGVSGTQPVNVHMTVTQWLRAVPKH